MIEKGCNLNGKNDVKGGMINMANLLHKNGLIHVRDDRRMLDEMRCHGLHGHVMIGHGVTTDPVTGISSLNEVVLESDNEILQGGTIYTLEKIFNVASPLQVAYLNEIMGIGESGPTITDRFPKNNAICLWNVGIGGCGDAYTDVKAVLQQHRALQGMIPFRVVDEPFEVGTEEYDKYWLMKETEDGKFAYYAKTFESEPVIRALWKDADDDEDGSPVVDSDYTSTKTTPIETFAQCVLKLTKYDLREYFELYDQIEYARFNTMGLLTGIKSTLADGKDEYKQVLQATALAFSNEMLHMGKDLDIIYRVYTA